MLNVTVVGDRELIARLEALPEGLRVVLRRSVAALAIMLQAHIVRDKLSGQVLKVRSGALRRSIHQRVVETAAAILGEVFSSGDVKYAGIHEFGGKTPPHDIFPKAGNVLAFMMGGRQIFAARVHHPGSVMPERSYMRTGLADMRGEITTTLRSAVIHRVAQGLHGSRAA